MLHCADTVVGASLPLDVLIGLRGFISLKSLYPKQQKNRRIAATGFSYFALARYEVGCSTFTWVIHTIIDRGRPFGCFVSLLSLGDEKPKHRFAVRGSERKDPRRGDATWKCFTPNSKKPAALLQRVSLIWPWRCSTFTWVIHTIIDAVLFHF
ncbi:hypothetical protein PSMA106859_22465 [Pseudoalteromonas maricaloris]